MTNSTISLAPVQSSNWNEQKNRLQEKFASLTDSDFYFEEVKKDKMLNKFQVKPGKTKEEIYAIISGL